MIFRVPRDPLQAAMSVADVNRLGLVAKPKTKK
jgi:hypothetical protein